MFSPDSPDFIAASRVSTPDPATEYIVGTDNLIQSFDEYPEAPDGIPDHNSPSLPPSPTLSQPPSPPPTPFISFATTTSHERGDDDIRTEYHTSSNRPPVTVRFEDYGRSQLASESRGSATSSRPWKPFSQRIDYEVADLIHDAVMTKAQTNKLLSLMHRCAGGEHLKLKNHSDVQKRWDQSTVHHTPVYVYQFYVLAFE